MEFPGKKNVGWKVVGLNYIHKTKTYLGNAVVGGGIVFWLELIPELKDLNKETSGSR